MHVTLSRNAGPYTAPEHEGMAMFRLQGKEASPTRFAWAGHSHILPGGGTSLKASPQEKIYIVVEGRVTVSNGDEEVTLEPMDSVAFAPNEARRLENRTTKPASILLIMEETGP